MKMKTREAKSVAGMPYGPDREATFYSVGVPYDLAKERYVTRITVTDDLPGLHVNMERVRVYDGDDVIFEGPLHGLEGVTYEKPEA